MTSFTDSGKIYRTAGLSDIIRLLLGSDGAIPLSTAEFAVVSDMNCSWYIRVTIYGHVVSVD